MRVPVDPSNAEAIRPLSTPLAVTVREGPGGRPEAVLLGGQWRRVDRIDDLWWMPEPLTRTYYRVGREDGGEFTLFRDLREDLWYRQDS